MLLHPRVVHRFAVATAVATYLLILIGGLVHGTGSSLACPDWPTCYGTLMPKMEGGVLVEHSHRLAAGTVVILTLALPRAAGSGAATALARISAVAVYFHMVLGGLVRHSGAALACTDVPLCRG